MNLKKAVRDFFTATATSFSLRDRITSMASGDDDMVPGSVVALALANEAGELFPLDFQTKTANYTLTLADSGKKTRMNKSTAVNFTVPNNSTEEIPIGFQHLIRQVGAGQVTLVAASGVTINTPESLTTRKQHSDIALHKVGINEWDASGDLDPA